MGPSKIILINDHSKIEATYNASIKYLDDHDDIKKDFTTHLWAYHEIGDIVPQTIDNVFSGHFFPYLESYLHLENSCELCLQGFYTYAFFALRSALELGILYVNFALNDKEYEELKNGNRSSSVYQELHHSSRNSVAFVERSRCDVSATK